MVLKAVVNGCEAVGDWWIEGGERRRRKAGNEDEVENE